MKAIFLLVLALPLLAVLACSASISIGEGECLYQGLELTEVTDSTGAVHTVREVEIELERADDLKFCGVSRQAKSMGKIIGKSTCAILKPATPTEVDGKYFFTAGGAQIEAEALGRFAWHLVDARWD